MSIQQLLLSQNNPLTTCPPGELSGQLSPGTAPLVLVASFPGSGTHLLIDAILNNFDVYKRQPLYVDLDKYLKQGYPLEELLQNGGYIVKTHFPHFQTEGYDSQIRRIAERAVVLMPVRPPLQLFSSVITLGLFMDKPLFRHNLMQFEKYWWQFEPRRISFAALTAQSNYEDLIQEIGQHIGIAPNQNLIYPIDRDQQRLMYTLKLLTRLLGHKSPIVNTTTAFTKWQKWHKEAKQVM